MSDDPISDELSPFVPDIFEKLDSTLPFPQKTGIDRAAWDKFVDISMPEGSQKIDRQTFDSYRLILALDRVYTTAPD